MRADEIILNLWWQFAYPTVGDDLPKDGRWAGGLSALEYAEYYLREKGLINNNGVPQWEKIEDERP